MARPPTAILVLLTLLIGPLCSLAWAQERAIDPLQLEIDPLAVTGEGFAGIVLPAAEVGQAADAMELAGQRAWAWGRVAAIPGAPPTQRLMLEGDVRMTLGTLELRARRLHAWIQPLQGGRGHQFYLLLEDALMPTSAPGVGISGPVVPIEGRLAPGARLDLSAIVLERSEPEAGSMAAQSVVVAERLFADRLRDALGLALPEVTADELAAEDAALRGVLDLARERLGSFEAREPILPMRGRVSFAASGIEQVRLGDGSDGSPPYAVVLRGPVVIVFDDVYGGRRAQLSAQDAVVFHKAELVGTPRLDAGDVMGVYLEGEVVADIERERGGRQPIVDRFRVRSPRVYYDLANDRALLLDAVFRADPAGSPVPIYIRAREIRQRSLRELTATSARVTTTGFFRPLLALGASTLKLRLEDDSSGGSGLVADARNLTLRAGDVPFLYWPIYVGDPAQIPLRNIGFETGNRHGEVVRTTWDGFALVGADAPAGVDLDLLIDAYFRRGPALGGELRWNGRAGGSGNLFVYNVINDTFRDLLPTGARIDRDSENRTVAMFEHLGKINDEWTLRAEASWFSDENVVGAFFPSMTWTRREPMTGASLQRIDEQSMLLLGANVQTNDFLISDYQLRSRGYATERLPELRYARTGDSLLGGLVTYSSDSRVGLLRLSFTEPTAEELGFVNNRRAQAALGISPSESPGDRLRAEGLDESEVFRFTTQHDVSTQFDVGALRVQPFVTGRFTAYDTDFDDFSAVTGDDADSLVASGAVGTRFSTELTRVYNGIDLPALDLYRMRHVIEPNATVWYGDGTVAQGAIPVYDENVEDFARGPAVRFGVDQTFQTMRGSLGGYESVDVLRVGAHFVFAGEDRPDADRTPRFFDAYPERSQLGDFFDLDVAWRLTDAVGVTGQFIYDLESNRTAEGVVGVEISQLPDMRFFAELRRLGYSEDTYINAGADYELGDRYSLGALGVYNERAGEFQSGTIRVNREMPHLILTARLTYNDITGDTTVGFSFQPTGINRGRDRVSRLGASLLGN